MDTESRNKSRNHNIQMKMKFAALIVGTSAFVTNVRIGTVGREATMAYMYSQAYSNEFATAINSVRGSNF